MKRKNMILVVTLALLILGGAAVSCAGGTPDAIDASGDTDTDTDSDTDGDTDSDTDTESEISIVVPGDGSEHPHGTTLTVEWGYTGLPQNTLFTVSLTSLDFPQGDLVLAEDVPALDASTGACDVVLSDGLVTGEYTIRVEAQGSEPEICDDVGIIVFGVELPIYETYINRTYLRMSRDLIGVPRDTTSGQAVFLSWRMLLGDDDLVQYEVRRSDTYDADCASNAYESIATVSRNNYMDGSLTEGDTHYYCVRTIWNGIALDATSNIVEVLASSGAYNTTQGATITLPVGGTCPSHAYTLANGVVPGDLDGNGTMDLVVRFCEQDGGICSGSEYFIEAFLRNDAGHWEPTWCHATNSTKSVAIVWDLDRDGRAEVVTFDNNATTIVALDGETGDLVATGSNEAYADGDNNHRWYSRFNVAYLNAISPHLVAQNNHFGGSNLNNTVVIGALAYSGDSIPYAINNVYQFEWTANLGTHGLPVADLDGNGRDEIVPCGKALHLVSGDLVELWTIPNPYVQHHDDTCFPGDIVPAEPGLETFFGLERNSVWVEAGVGVVDMDGQVIWTEENSTFEGPLGTADFHGWEKGTCFESDLTNDGMECFTFEICEDNGCMGSQGLDFNDYWTKSHIFDGSDGSVVQTWPPQDDNTIQRTGLDWDNGDGVVNTIGSGLGTGLYHKKMDFVGDSRMEIVELDDNQMIVHVSAVENDTRYLSPLYDPNYFKPMTQHANGGYSYTSAAHSSQTFVLACDVGPVKSLDVTAGDRVELICGVGSQLGFEGTVSLSSDTDLDDVHITFGPSQQETLDIVLASGETALFRVFVDAEESTEIGNTRFRVDASSDNAEFSFDRRIVFLLSVQ